MHAVFNDKWDSSVDIMVIKTKAPGESSSSSQYITVNVRKLKRNLLLTVDREAARYGLTNRAATCICTAILVDYCLITAEKTDRNRKFTETRNWYDRKAHRMQLKLFLFKASSMMVVKM